ncbi:hypothetical protein [Mesorhizobium sp.]|uniref:hypothetical protein n=1 Tax=Mesorhizobium sp. TaxID=1871066 RepID=UPI00257B5CEE|nr:hypothetical protein [Mesorhizobium sp.]
MIEHMKVLKEFEAVLASCCGASDNLMSEAVIGPSAAMLDAMADLWRLRPPGPDNIFKHPSARCMPGWLSRRGQDGSQLCAFHGAEGIRPPVPPAK